MKILRTLAVFIAGVASCFGAVAPVNVQKFDGVANLITANLVVGDGKSITPTGSGQIVATNFSSSTTISQALDLLGSTRGSILIRGVSGWTILVPGNSGYSLVSNGAGADPSYQPGGSGSGDVTGPSSATDNAITRFDSTTGKIIQNSVGILSDTGALSGLISLNGLSLTAATANTFWAGPASGGAGNLTARAMVNADIPVSTLGYNVIKYGAVGNGTTDDTSAINAAITAAGTSSTVYFPLGIYAITSTITPLAGQVWIFRPGAVLEMLSTSGFTGAELVAASVASFTVQGATFRGSSSNTGQYAISVTADFFRMIDCHLDDNKLSRLVIFVGANYGQVLNCSSTGTGPYPTYTGVEIEINDSSYALVDGCRIIGNSAAPQTDNGIEIFGGSSPARGVQVTNNFFGLGAGGVYLLASEGALISGNTFRRTRYEAVLVNSQSQEGSRDASRNVISGNFFEDCGSVSGHYPIYVDTAGVQNQIIGNSFSITDVSLVGGIALVAVNNGPETLIQNNIMQGGSITSIYITTNGTNARVSGNMMLNPGTSTGYGIITISSGGRFTNNSVIDNRGGSAKLYDGYKADTGSATNYFFGNQASGYSNVLFEDAGTGNGFVTVPLVTGNMVNTGDTGTVSNTMLVGPVSYAKGGTGATSFTNHGVVVAGASALSTVAPSTSGNVLTSNGTDWTSAAATGGVTSITGTSGQVTASASTGAVTLSLPSSLTGINNITTAAPNPMVLALGTGGTVLTLSSSPNLGTFAGGLNITGALGGVTNEAVSGIQTLGGTKITTENAMGALAIDVTKALNTKTVSTDSTFTFSGTPGANRQWFGMLVTNSDTADHTLTIPSSFSIGRQATITTVTIPASGKLLLNWNYFSSAYDLYNDPPATNGTGPFALTNGATFVAPILGTPASGTMTNVSGFPKADVFEASLFAADAGSTDAYVITLTPAITAYVTGAHYWFKANTANTGAATININSVGAKTIVKAAGGITTALSDNDIRAGQWVDLVYDGTNMQMQSLLGNAPAGAGTVTTVGWTGGIVSVANPTSTPAFTIAGTSGGIPYFSGSTTWASSAALTANSPVLGGGAGTAPSTIAGITSDGTSKLILGVNTTTLGAVKMFGNTSGDATIQPAAVAGTATTITLPATTGTLAILGANTFTGTQLISLSTTLGLTSTSTSTNKIENRLNKNSGTQSVWSTAVAGSSNADSQADGAFYIFDAINSVVGLSLAPSTGNAVFSGTLSVGTSNKITAGTYEIGAASDTTLGRVSAGVASIEGSNIMTVGGTDTITGVKTFSTAAVLGSSTATTQTAGDASTKVSTTAYADRDSQLQYNAQTGTTYTLVLTDGTPGSTTAGVSLSNASAVTLTIPTNASVAFPTGWTIPILSLGAGAVTIAPAGGVTINSPGGLLTIGTQYGTAVLNKTGTNTWQVYGLGSLPSVVSGPRLTGQTAAASLTAYTVGAADSSFLVSANVLVTTSTVHSFTTTCTYSDEGNTSRTLTLTFSNVGGTLVTAIANAAGAVPYEGVPLHIRAKAATTITFATVGTFTTVTYNVEGVVTQIK